MGKVIEYSPEELECLRKKYEKVVKTPVGRIPKGTALRWAKFLNRHFHQGKKIRTACGIRSKVPEIRKQSTDLQKGVPPPTTKEPSPPAELLTEEALFNEILDDIEDVQTIAGVFSTKLSAVWAKIHATKARLSPKNHDEMVAKIKEKIVNFAEELK
jgi:hypothetical protein